MVQKASGLLHIADDAEPDVRRLADSVKTISLLDAPCKSKEVQNHAPFDSESQKPAGDLDS